MNNARLLTLTSLYQLIALALLLLVSLASWRDGTLSLLFGGGFGAMNFYALRALVTRTVVGQGNKVMWSLALALKTVTTLGVLVALLLVLQLDVRGFAAGLATLFVGLAAALTHMAMRARLRAQG
jgi:hypothetical protein